LGHCENKRKARPEIIEAGREFVVGLPYG